MIQDYDRNDRVFLNRTAIHKNAPKYINITIALLKQYKKPYRGLTAPQKAQVQNSKHLIANYSRENSNKPV
jgi:hypothetical protein